MAYRRRYSRPVRRMYRKGRYYSKKMGSSFGNFHMRWGIGAVAGVMAPRVHPMQDMLITAVAVAPVRMPYGIKSLAQGYVGGMLLKPFMGSFASVSTSGGDQFA